MDPQDICKWLRENVVWEGEDGGEWWESIKDTPEIQEAGVTKHDVEGHWYQHCEGEGEGGEGKDDGPSFEEACQWLKSNINWENEDGDWWDSIKDTEEIQNAEVEKEEVETMVGVCMWAFEGDDIHEVSFWDTCKWLHENVDWESDDPWASISGEEEVGEADEDTFE